VLLKYKRGGTYQDGSEKIAAELARQIGLRIIGYQKSDTTPPSKNSRMLENTSGGDSAPI